MPVQEVLIQSAEVINGGALSPTPLSARFDKLLLEKHVFSAMLRFVKNELGDDFYDALVVEKGTTESNYNEDLGPIVPAFTTPEYESLWKYVLRDLCAAAVVHVSLPYIGTQIGSNGIFEINTEYAQTTGRQGAKHLQDEELKRINILQDEMKKYLCANSESYPLYDSEKNCEDCEHYSNKTKQINGFVIYKTRSSHDRKYRYYRK